MADPKTNLADALKEDHAAIFRVLRNCDIDPDAFSAIASITHSRIKDVEEAQATEQSGSQLSSAEAQQLTLPEWPDSELVEILGRPNFTCIGIAQLIRLSGVEVPRKAESEQAYTIHFLIRHWLSSKESWRESAEAELREMAQAT